LGHRRVNRSGRRNTDSERVIRHASGDDLANPQAERQSGQLLART
jgi:hypothetical protein